MSKRALNPMTTLHVVQGGGNGDVGQADSEKASPECSLSFRDD